jgi:hypothetical protein
MLLDVRVARRPLVKRGAVVSSDPCGHSVLAHGRVADLLGLGSGPCVTRSGSESNNGWRVGDVEGIVLAIASGEVTP